MLEEVLRRLCAEGPFDSARERAVAIHDYVRDHIAFGFTLGFETVTPQQTLACRRGHCNAQGDLMRALLAAAGIRARLRFVRLDKRVLRQAVPAPVYRCLPSYLFHAVTQVEIDGGWQHADSYLFPPSTFARQQRRLAATGWAQGHGVHRAGRCDWRADGDAFAQANARDLAPDDPVFDSLAAAMTARAGNNRLLGLHFNQWLAAVPSPLRHTAERYLNSRLGGE